jgi:transcriptional regulator with XRE-family HTH domain
MLRVGKTARYLRDCKGLSQREAAEALGITQVHLSNIENNKSHPSPELLARYRELWDVDLYVLAWCLNGDETRLPAPVRRSMQQLAKAWRRELGTLLPSEASE